MKLNIILTPPKDEPPGQAAIEPRNTLTLMQAPALCCPASLQIETRNGDTSSNTHRRKEEPGAPCSRKSQTEKPTLNIKGSPRLEGLAAARQLPFTGGGAHSMVQA